MAGITIAGKKVPCGCESRQEIMFDHGKPGVTEAAIVFVPLLTLIIVLGVKYHHG